MNSNEHDNQQKQRGENVFRFLLQNVLRTGSIECESSKFRSFLLFLVLFITATSLPAEQIVGGVINRNTRWNAEDGPYRLIKDLVIARNYRLTISPGTRVIIETVPGIDTMITQTNRIDSSTIAIKVHGSLICIGRFDKRITFLPTTENRSSPLWYGIELIEADEQFTEIAYTDIANAYIGVTVENCSPLVRNSILEFNHIGLSCINFGSVRFFNNIIANNTAAGIRVTRSNPTILNNIIYNNHNTGIWCDGASKLTFEYNCVFGNRDQDFLECNPEYCINAKKNKNGDSVDIFKNICADPIFSGSPADSAARIADLNIPTDPEKIKNHTIASIVQSVHDSVKTKYPKKYRYTLSPYSPCRDAGNPSRKFNDRDETKNDMGIFGGPKFIDNN